MAAGGMVMVVMPVPVRFRMAMRRAVPMVMTMRRTVM